MKPHWQIFLTEKLLLEINELLGLVERLRLRERVQELGSEFQLFMHTPGPDYEGRKIENLHPTIDEVASLPDEILESSRKHLGRDILWWTEGELYSTILEGRDKAPRDERVLDEPTLFWLFVTNSWDTFSNVGTLEPWWKLGNLRVDSVETVMRRFEQDEILGLDNLFNYPQDRLTREYGNPHGRKIYSSKHDLLSLYHAKHCERVWNNT